MSNPPKQLYSVKPGDDKVNMDFLDDLLTTENNDAISVAIPEMWIT